MMHLRSTLIEAKRTIYLACLEIHFVLGFCCVARAQSEPQRISVGPAIAGLFIFNQFYIIVSFFGKFSGGGRGF